jgi:hypothetical protein
MRKSWGVEGPWGYTALVTTRPQTGTKPLLTLLKSNPEEVYSLTIKQVVALCGDGVIKDGSTCSNQFREFLSTVDSEHLFRYTEACLESAFEKSGLVLQDLINELGRRLDYDVENGPYQGRTNITGFDGIWRAGSTESVIEVKTTDAYRINLDTIAGYRDELIAAGKISKSAAMLLVVGREDTGDLEAQVRGSRHAWSIRILSTDALIKLVTLKENTEDDTTAKIHELLVPFEYTKLDRIIDIAFVAAKDATSAVEQERPETLDKAPPDVAPAKQQHTATEIIEVLRSSIINKIAQKLGTHLVRKSRALFWSPDKKIRVVNTLSKEFKGGIYWFAYHPEWDAFLMSAERGYLVLGCLDRSEAYAIPFDWIHPRLDQLYQTDRGNKTYWHIQLYPGPEGKPTFKVGKSGQVIDIQDMLLKL